MSRPDIWAAFAADPTARIILDRRGRHIADAAAAIGLAVAERWSIEGPFGPVHAALLTNRGHPEEVGVPGAIALKKLRYVRLVDRFFLPENPGPIVSAALFDVVASHYDDLTRQAVNTKVAESLLRAVCNERAERQTVLDFGCGTGVAHLSATRLALEGISIELIGTDLCEAMLRLAAARGEKVMPLPQWRSLPADGLDGAIAVFVLHYGVPQTDLAALASQLKMGRRFAANYFKPPLGAVSRLESSLAAEGLRLEREEPLDMTSADNVLLVFRKERSGNVDSDA
ncbi:methyltransferase domain-containing protein [Bradyrhizobium sp. HKCCYLS2038]|uniref:methyltransferase domain-containing protein n=1 Tax=unclassified Bradyrhizobium TaxID=2631580 RepID=UPI003EBA6DE0